MPSESSSDVKFEIGHVLFIDIVGYSKLLINEQSDQIQKLKAIVRGTEQVRIAEAEGKLLRLPTGDGGALVFRTSPEAPVLCALEVSKALESHPELRVRMGIHSGPVNEIADLNEQANIAGAGINVAQRVMDCGDAGHILLSKRVADDLEQYPQWRSLLHELGECEIKHGMRLSVVNLYTDGLGNPDVPEKFKKAERTQTASIRRARPSFVAIISVVSLIAVAVAAVIFASLILRSRGNALGKNPRIANERPTAPIPDKSIAVLPFENLSANQENAFFTDGVQDEILTDLAKVADLKVISRTSVMQYKATTARNLPEIAQALKVANVLEGSVQRSANRVRVSAQLIDARTDTHIWAENYDRELSDVFAIQSEIAQAIADQLQAKLSPKEKAAIDERPTKDLVAYDLYLKAKQLREEDILNQSNARENILQGIQLLNEAVARDPRFLLAHCLLALAHDAFYSNFEHTEARRALAEASVQAAVRLKPDSGETHLAQGTHYYLGYLDYGRARAELLKAQRALPNDALVAGFLGYIARRQGNWDDAVREMTRAVELDPNGGWLDDLGEFYSNLRRYKDAAAIYDRALLRHPMSIPLRVRRALVDRDADASLAPLRRVINTIGNESPSAEGEVAEYAFDLAAACERDPAAAERAVAALARQPRENLPFPTAFCEGLVARLRHDESGAHAAFVVARAENEQLVRTQPKNSVPLGMLAFIDASMDNKKKAIEEALAACALSPLDKDALEGALRKSNLARVYALTGERDLALEELTTVSKLPGGLSYGELKLYPEWDSLRGDARFEKILASLAPKAAPK